jgi:hypothetical protein
MGSKQPQPMPEGQREAVVSPTPPPKRLTFEETMDQAGRYGRAMAEDYNRRFESMKRLQKLLKTDPFVYAHWCQWLNGSYANIEDFLVTLVVAMAERHERVMHPSDYMLRPGP